jgi:hypothetical protein
LVQRTIRRTNPRQTFSGKPKIPGQPIRLPGSPLAIAFENPRRQNLLVLRGLLDCAAGSDLRYRKDRDEEGHMAAWDKAKAAALKILGNTAVVPDLAASINKASETFDKTNDAFKASREDCEDKLLQIEDATSALGNAVKQFQATIEKSDFKLDSKNKDEAKKIQQARKILTGELSSASKDLATITKTLDELDKHLIQLGKYKPSDPPLK